MDYHDPIKGRSGNIFSHSMQQKPEALGSKAYCNWELRTEETSLWPAMFKEYKVVPTLLLLHPVIWRLPVVIIPTILNFIHDLCIIKNILTTIIGFQDCCRGRWNGTPETTEAITKAS